MSSRREFIRAGTMAASVIAGRGISYGAEVEANAPAVWNAAVPLYAVIFDDRFAESRSFAAAARQEGLRTRSLDSGDVTRLWYDDLYHRWKEKPAAIAGLTTHNAMFVLETFGNDAGLRLQFRAEHRRYADRVTHRLYGPDSLLRTTLSLENCGTSWASRMGKILSVRSSRRFGRCEAEAVTALPADSPHQSELLVSWVLAPRMPRAASFNV